MESQNFFGLDGLTSLSKRSGIDMRPTLLRVLTDLYVHRLSHAADEERHYTELALRMLEAVDVPTRVAVAKRFARYPSPPLRVLQWLARDLPIVAAELRAHPLLQPPTAAQRAGASTAETHLDRAEWRSAEPPRNMDAATAGELNELFLAAGADERRLILLNLDIVAPPHGGAGGRFAAAPSVGQDLEAAVLTGKPDYFAVRLAQALLIPHEQARRIARDELGEPVVVAGKALGMARDVLYRILMFVNPAVGHSVERVHALAALHGEMTVTAAESMVEIWQALRDDERARARHRPLTSEEETRQRARFDAAAPRRPAAAANDRRRAS